MLKDLITDLETLGELEKYYIIFGVLEEDKYHDIKINILNPDETISKATMTVGDVMYLTEYGTVVLPGKHILDRTLYYVNYKLDNMLNEILDGVFKNHWDKGELDSKMQEFSIQLQEFVRAKIESEVENRGMDALLGIKDSKEYLYNLNKLKQYIHCKIFKK